MDDGRGDVAGEWLDLGQFARRLGIARSSVYGRVRRGTLQTRPKGNRGLEILWQPSRHHRENGSGHAAQVADLRERLATAKAECLAARAVAIAEWLRLPWWRRMLGN